MSAIDCLHNASPPLIHRDLKPENILISDMGAKIADFGLVKALADMQPDNDVDALEGTQWPGMPWRYRTPELVKRALDHTTPITPASDIYQFGTVFYELLTGFNPQIQPSNITDPITVDCREIRGEQGRKLYFLLKAMLREEPSLRPTASNCVQRLNKIHQLYCESLFTVTGDHV